MSRVQIGEDSAPPEGVGSVIWAVFFNRYDYRGNMSRETGFSHEELEVGLIMQIQTDMSE
jgi:hypothetical protein